MRLLRAIIVVAVLISCLYLDGVYGVKAVNRDKEQNSLDQTTNHLHTKQKVAAPHAAATAVHKKKKEDTKKTITFPLRHEHKSEERQKEAVKNLQAHHQSFVSKKSTSTTNNAKKKLEKAKSRTAAAVAASSGNITTSLALMNYYDVEWLAPIEVGTPAQTFEVIFDTGSTDLWLPSMDCTTSGCESQPRFDSSLSSTFVSIGTQFSSSYGSGTLFGYQGMDTVTLGDLTVQNLTFGLITSEVGDWSSGGDPFDGLFGLGFRALSDMPTVTPFFEAVVDQGVLAENAVTFFFGHYDNEDAARITFGTPPRSQYVGEISYLNVTQQVYWQVTLVDVKVGDTYLNICDNIQCDAILDTGTTLMTVPSQSLGSLLDAINAADDCSNWDSLPNVTFVLSDAGGQYEFSLEPDYYMESFGDGECAPAFMSMDVADWENYWILGDYFMRKFLTVYHWGDASTNYQPRVGIALASG